MTGQQRQGADTLRQLVHAKVGRPQATLHQSGHGPLELPQRRLLVPKAADANVGELQGACYQHGIIAAPLPILRTPYFA